MSSPRHLPAIFAALSIACVSANPKDEAIHGTEEGGGGEAGGGGEGGSASETGSGGEVGGAETGVEDSAAPEEEPPTRFAVVGDYGDASPEEALVATMIAWWEPEFILTTGDNNYFFGARADIDENIGQFYHSFIYPYAGSYGGGAETNRFFPCLGNHDWNEDEGVMPYTDYFTLPGVERYYEQSWGAVHFFCVDSDENEPMGVTADSEQALWLQSALASSTAPWQIVYFHHPPWTSGTHGPSAWMEWPFAEWGADLVLMGHEHHYERLVVDGLPAIISGHGGVPLRAMEDEVHAHSQLATNEHHGALRVEASSSQMVVESVGIGGVIIDQVRLLPGRLLQAETEDETLIASGDSLLSLPLGEEPPEGWTELSFDDSDWLEGTSPIGYGDAGLSTDIGLVPAEGGQVTTWYRHRFEAVGNEQNMWLWLLVDDGAAVYLNGDELLRQNLPEGALGPETLTLTTIGGDMEGVWQVYELSAHALRGGENVLAVELHQGSATSSDAWLEMWLVADQDQLLLSNGATWRWWIVEPPAGWQEPESSPVGASSGPAPLGRGTDSEATVLTGAGAVTWLRADFDVDDVDDIPALMLRAQASDGAVVWLNGVEVWRANALEGDVGALSAAPGPALPGWRGRNVETWLPTHMLVEGDNTLTVALLAADPADPQLWWEAELRAPPADP